MHLATWSVMKMHSKQKCIRSFVESKADRATNAERLRKNVSVGSNLFHLYNGLQTELLKRLAESQWKGEWGTVGNWLHYTSAVDDSHPIYSTRSWAVKGHALLEHWSRTKIVFQLLAFSFRFSALAFHSISIHLESLSCSFGLERFWLVLGP